MGLHSQGTWTKETPLPLEGLDVTALTKKARVGILVVFPYAGEVLALSFLFIFFFFFRVTGSI